MPVNTSDDRRIEPGVSDATLARMNVLLGGPWEPARNVRVFTGGHLYNLTIDDDGNANIESREGEPTTVPTIY